MLIYSRDAMSWEEYLQLNVFDEDIKDRIRRSGDSLAPEIAALQWTTNEIIATEEKAAKIISAAGTTTSYRLGGLSARFDWAMGKVLWKLEIQQSELAEILEPLQAPLDTQAKELRKRAETAYIQGWYDEALNDFLESEEKNYQDFTVHQSIGNIYLYHKLDLDKALESFLKGGKYAEPHSAYHSAYTYLHAGFVCYLQRKDTEAVQHTAKAIKLFPKLSEAHYNHAKFAAVTANAEVAISSLETAILADKRYCLKANADKDFTPIRNEVQALFEKLRQKARDEAEAHLQKIDEELLNPPITKFLQDTIQTERNSIKDAMDSANNYFGNLDFIEELPACEKKYADYVEEISNPLNKARNLKDEAKKKEEEHKSVSRISGENIDNEKKKRMLASLRDDSEKALERAEDLLKLLSEDLSPSVAVEAPVVEAILELAEIQYLRSKDKKESASALVLSAQEIINSGNYRGTLPGDIQQRLQKLMDNPPKPLWGGCFIATATYGSPLAKEVVKLSNFRATVLSQFGLGRWFVESYYRLSPPIARRIAQHGFLKKMARLFLIQPLLLLAKKIEKAKD